MLIPADIQEQEKLLQKLKQHLHSNHYIANIVKKYG